MPRVLWINLFANVTFSVIILATFGIEPMTPRIGIKHANLSAIRDFINQWSSIQLMAMPAKVEFKEFDYS